MSRKVGYRKPTYADRMAEASEKEHKADLKARNNQDPAHHSLPIPHTLDVIVRGPVRSGKTSLALLLQYLLEGTVKTVTVEDYKEHTKRVLSKKLVNAHKVLAGTTIRIRVEDRGIQ
jgi:type II secretory ATPase GspE/PulE/Tfp pilus assembly ATPase PilB-like protein